MEPFYGTTCSLYWESWEIVLLSSNPIWLILRKLHWLSSPRAAWARPCPAPASGPWPRPRPPPSCCSWTPTAAWRGWRPPRRCRSSCGPARRCPGPGGAAPRRGWGCCCRRATGTRTGSASRHSSNCKTAHMLCDLKLIFKSLAWLLSRKPFYVW